MRLFLAIFPPSEVQQAASRVIAEMSSRGDGVSWVKRENLHYTLRFLGEQDADGERRAIEAAGAAAAQHAPFGATLGGLGAFPTAKRARVLWIGMLRGAEPMRLLAASLEKALVERDFGAEEHAFEPHLTIGRVRTPADWTNRLISGPMIEAPFRIDRLSLVRSTLAKGGSEYEVTAEAPLGR